MPNSTSDSTPSLGLGFNSEIHTRFQDEPVQAASSLNPKPDTHSEELQIQESKESIQYTVDRGWLIRAAGSIIGCNYEDERTKVLKAKEDSIESERQYINTQYQYVRQAVGTLVDSKSVTRFVTHKNPIVDITIQITGRINPTSNQPDIKWCMFGTALAELHRMIPCYSTLVVKGNQRFYKKTRPRVGTNHSRWYPIRGTETMMLRIALELRLLQLFCYDAQIVERKVAKSSNATSGILDLDITADLRELVEFDAQYGTRLADIPKKYKGSRINPYKEAQGVYYFHKNGTRTDRLNTVLDELSDDLPGIFGEYILWPRDLETEAAKQQVKKQFKSFLDTQMVAGLVGFGRHTRILVRDSWDSTIHVLDPWIKSGVSRHFVFLQMATVVRELGFNLKFASRARRDQPKREGSCSIAALARAINIVLEAGLNEKKLCPDRSMSRMTHKHNLADLFESPLTDSAVLLASCAIRTL